jgi:hypothetical protein
MWSGGQVPMFQRNLLLPSSGLSYHESDGSRFLQMLVPIYQTTHEIMNLILTATRTSDLKIKFVSQLLVQGSSTFTCSRATF